MELDKEKLVDALNKLLNIGDSYVYTLTRIKGSQQYGTMTIDDFVEWDDETIEELADGILEYLQSKQEERLDD